MWTVGLYPLAYRIKNTKQSQNITRTEPINQEEIRWSDNIINRIK